MTDRPIFFYATGTAYTPSFVEGTFFKTQMLPIGDQLKDPIIVPGTGGRQAPFSGLVTDDPFPVLLNPDLWEAVKVPYPASAFPMDQSIQSGVDWVMNAVNTLPSGRPWAVGGQSQGAAVMSRIYNEVRSGSLTGRASSFLGGVGFGNPCRQLNFTNPWSSYSGAFGVPGSTTGGHGSFPSSYRLSGCEEGKWLEFTMPSEVITGVGDDPVGAWWTAGNGIFLAQTIITPGSPGSFTFNAITFLLGVGATALSMGIPFVPNFIDELSKHIDPNRPDYVGPGPMTDLTGKSIQLPGGGHTRYAGVPPYGYGGTETCYQLALKHFEDLALEWATSGAVIPPVSQNFPGWSTTLRPPAY